MNDEVVVFLVLIPLTALNRTFFMDKLSKLIHIRFANLYRNLHRNFCGQSSFNRVVGVGQAGNFTDHFIHIIGLCCMYPIQTVKVIRFVNRNVTDVLLAVLPGDFGLEDIDFCSLFSGLRCSNSTAASRALGLRRNRHRQIVSSVFLQACEAICQCSTGFIGQSGVNLHICILPLLQAKISFIGVNHYGASLGTGIFFQLICRHITQQVNVLIPGGHGDVLNGNVHGGLREFLHRFPSGGIRINAGRVIGGNIVAAQEERLGHNFERNYQLLAAVGCLFIHSPGAAPILGEIKPGDGNLLTDNRGTHAFCTYGVTPFVVPGARNERKRNIFGCCSIRQLKVGGNHVPDDGILIQFNSGAAGFNASGNLLEDAAQCSGIGSG